jgi:hypothetical protein
MPIKQPQFFDKFKKQDVINSWQAFFLMLKEVSHKHYQYKICVQTMYRHEIITSLANSIDE